MSSKSVLSLDLGPTSIGWALIDEHEKTIRAAGVRVFPEGVDRDKQGGEKSKNESRRQARGIRRQIARRARRKRVLRAALTEVGLLPAAANRPASDSERRSWEDTEFKQSNPYALRRTARDQKVELHELGRIFLHLAQHRGFLSNRKADKAKKAEDSKILTEISDLAAKIEAASCRTLGEYLAKLHEADPTSRVRKLHTRRQMYLDEFEAIWREQSKHHPQLLTDRLKYGTRGRAEYPQKPVQTGGGPKRLLERFGIHGLIFFQRPMYWPKSVVGRCELDPKQKRCPRADRAAQEFRILCEINNLRIVASDGEVKELTTDQREKVLQLLGAKKEVKFDELRKKLGLLEHDGFNLEAGERRKLDGHKTDATLAEKKYCGKAWFDRSGEERTAIVRSLIHDDEATFRSKASGWNIDLDLAERLLDVNLPDSYSSYGRETIERLLPHLRQGFPLTSREGSNALEAAGFLPVWKRAAKQGQFLPPPPKLTNPIVRQALFEVRKLTSAIIREFGKPDAIHVELAREVKGTAAQRAQRTWDMREREARRTDAAETIREFGDKPTHGKIERYLLWQEQSEVCMYSGRAISMAQLLGGEVDIDHILPYSQSLDDSLMNKVVCFRSENADKGHRTVHGWLAKTNATKYEQVVQRAARLPIEIRNRKLPRFRRETCELTQFINRQLTDTAYITSMVLAYLQNLGVELLGSKGQLTAELRHQWGLNTILRDDGLNLKTREDHRHHAVDAVVIAATTRGRLQQLAKHRGDSPLPPPWPTFRDDVENVINAINVSHRVRRKVAGALHDEKYYGATQQRLGGEKTSRPWAKCWVEKDAVYVKRKPLIELSLSEVARIRDDRVREVVMERLAEFGLIAGRKKRGTDESEEESVTNSSDRRIDQKVWKQDLRLTGRKGGSAGSPIRSVRILVSDKSIVQLKSDRLTFVKPNRVHHVALFEIEGENGKVRREPVFVSMLEAARRIRAGKPLIERLHPQFLEAKFLLSLSAGEMVRAQFKKQERLVRFSTAASTSYQMWFLDHTDARKSSEQEPFSAKPSTFIGEKVTVDILGRVWPASD